MTTDIIPDDSNGDKSNKVKQPPDKHTNNKKEYTAPSTAWKPGQSGNPKGRPKKGVALTDILRQELELPTKIGKARMTQAHAVARALVMKAREGDAACLRLLYERIDGKVSENINIEGNMQYTEIELRVLLNATRENPEIGKQIAGILKQSITAGDSS